MIELEAPVPISEEAVHELHEDQREFAVYHQ